MIGFSALNHRRIGDRIFTIFVPNPQIPANITHFLFVKEFAVAYCGCTGQADFFYPMWT
jgi:hypothetical protein